jgi:7-cyano-7-deazaguanine tRNA-ribosyltransferase
MLLVAGLSLKNLKPRVWDENSPYYLSNLRAVMVSDADFHRMPAQRCIAMVRGLPAYLGLRDHTKVYLDNGAFYFLGRDAGPSREEYEEFVVQARPDWWPIPQDFIPTPKMTAEEQGCCFTRAMEMNLVYQHDGYVPVIHISRFLAEYTAAVKDQQGLSLKPMIALGGIVPNLLRAPKALPYKEILDRLRYVRQTFVDKEIHVFGVGGTATFHLTVLLGMNSVDSSGWRNRAARGIVQLPGSGDRTVADLGRWRGREPNENEWNMLAACQCPACEQFGIEGLKSTGIRGFLEPRNAQPLDTLG